MAADPLGAVALAALGVEALSVPVNQFAAARRAQEGLTRPALDDLAPELLRQRSAAEVRGLLQRWRAGLFVTGW
jgi:phosphoenolpyruvate-protein kinase (PTS system EI component)